MSQWGGSSAPRTSASPRNEAFLLCGVLNRILVNAPRERSPRVAHVAASIGQVSADRWPTCV